ncbi:MAG: transposase family protein, partial [Treponema sp.]|nr:transposase family protein [Treponema sp.]
MMKAISIQDMARVVDYLDKINDPRRTAYGNIRHKLIDIIVIAFTSVLCGYEDYEDMEEFGRLKLGVCGALPKNCINLQFIANLYLANSQRSPVNRNFCMNMQKFTKVPQAP